MHSQEIRRAHESEYRRFFESNDLVVSGCYSVSWGNDLIDHQSAFPSIQMKVPLRCYVGIKKSAIRSVRFWTVLSYEHSLNEFQNAPYRSVGDNVTQSEAKVFKFLQENSAPFGLDIEFLTEVPRWHSFGFTETTSALISLGCHIMCWLEDKTNIGNLEISRNWKSIIGFWRELAINENSANVIKNGVRSTLSSYKWPTVYYSQSFDINDTRDYLSLRLGEFPIRNSPKSDEKLPFDFFVIYSWTDSDSRQIEEFKRKKSGRRGNVLFEKFISWSNEVVAETPWKFHEKLDASVLGDLKLSLWIKSVELMSEAMESWWDNEGVTDELIDNVNHFRYLLSFSSKQCDFAAEFLDAFRDLRSESAERIWICPLYSWKFGGSYLVAARLWISRQTIKRVLLRLNGKYPNSYMEYSSCEDAGDVWHPRIDQFVSQWMSSDYISEDKILYKNNLWEVRICNYGEVVGQKDELTVDAITNKIFFQWTKLTSKEVPSQNAAAELLRILINEIGSEVSNKKLPVSSYSKNKNEFSSKIVSPLSKFVRERMQ